jgi:hypothetical protein
MVRLKKMSELGLVGLKDDRIKKKKILIQTFLRMIGLKK